MIKIDYTDINWAKCWHGNPKYGQLEFRFSGQIWEVLDEHYRFEDYLNVIIEFDGGEDEVKPDVNVKKWYLHYVEEGVSGMTLEKAKEKVQKDAYRSIKEIVAGINKYLLPVSPTLPGKP